MPPSERSNEIAAAFQRLIKSGDKSKIESIEYNELETAIFDYYLDKNMPFYKAMEKRLNELKENKLIERQQQDKAKSEALSRKHSTLLVIFSFLAGILATLISQWIISLWK